MGFQRSKRRAQKSKRPTQKSKRPTQKSKRPTQKSKRRFLKSWAYSETTDQSSFPDLSALVTCNLCTRWSSKLEEANSEIGEASAFPDVSASVTCRVSFAEITGSLSKRQF
ncbi:hypothetical protein ACFX13_030730 [Malus domestica]